MEAMAIRFDCSFDHESCALCGKSLPNSPGPQLFLEVGGEPVCRACGKKEAPQMLALLELARAARRMGRVCKHTLIPPMETLLELARAAENYHVAVPEPLERVA